MRPRRPVRPCSGSTPGVCRGARQHDGSVLAEDLHAGEDEGGRREEEGGSVVSARGGAAHSCP